ncbi:MAG: acetylxylan esterase [Verrucomicrobia bacterium]|nr:acetylxylan esterase [Verrucomicrobiota bacterium]
MQDSDSENTLLRAEFHSSVAKRKLEVQLDPQSPPHTNVKMSHDKFSKIQKLPILFCILAVLLFKTQSCAAQHPEEPWIASSELAERWNRHINREGKTIEYFERMSKLYGPLNFVESKVPEYSLPDPLIFDDATPVTSADEWYNKRQPELMNAFRTYMYGRRPKFHYTLRFEKEEELTDAFNGAATARNMKAIVSIGDREFSFPFVVFIPNKVDKPVPAVVHIKFWHVSIENNIDEPDETYSIWPVKKLIERDYATESFFYENVEPDNKEGFVKGIRGFLAESKTPPQDAWGSLSAWAWGASRVLDYLESLDSVDTSRTAVSGHSRLGTAALWAACEDNRFAVVYSNCSGSTGAAITRRQFGLHARLSFGEFPLWYSSVFFDPFLQGQELPFDQHELIALIAPRGVYVSSADRDLAADPKGEYTSLVEAAPVFRLFAKGMCRRT